MAPLAFQQRQAVSAVWRDKRKAILILAVPRPVSCILVLAALRLAPLGDVATAREPSILFGTLKGAHLLREADSHRPVAGATIMVAGVVALAFA